MTYPHVAQHIKSLDAVGLLPEEDALKRLLTLRDVLVATSAALKRPGLVGKHAIDSVGTLLCPLSTGKMAALDPLAEQFRVFLMEDSYDDPSRETADEDLPQLPLVRLTQRSFEVLDHRAAEKLSPAQRLTCVAVKGCKQVARRYDATERKMSEFSVSFDNGAAIEVREQPAAGKAVLICSRPKGERTVLEAKIDAALLASLFEGAGKGRLSERARESPHAKRDSDTSWTLPSWASEHLATFAQDLLRVHVLFSAGESEGERAAKIFYLEHSKLTRQKSPEGDEYSRISSDLHAASGGCLCSLHGKRSSTKFAKLQFCLEICGKPLQRVDGAVCCERHSDELALESHHFPGVCKRACKVYAMCVHEHHEGAPRTTRVDFTHLVGGWRLDAMRELACCCVKATQQGCEVLDLIADADALHTHVQQQCLENHHTNEKLADLDNTAYWLLRSRLGEVKNGKLIKKTRGLKVQDVSRTHMHLFKRA